MLCVILLLLLPLVSAVSRTCSNPDDVCTNEDSFCVRDAFCMPNSLLDSQIALFSGGVASEFVEHNNGAEAKCFINLSGEIDDFVSALSSWENGDYKASAASLYQAVSDLKDTIADCTGSSSPEESFWSEMWHGFEAVLSGLCPECEVIITDAEYVIAGVDIIEDWLSMAQNCYDGASADELIDCGAAFGDSVVRIRNALEQ